MSRQHLMPRSLRTLFALGLTLTAVSGCQFLFDDFGVEATPPPLPRVCPSRAYQCNGAQLERCSDDRSRWEPVGPPCASESECNLSSESCRPCALNDLQCNGAQLLRCNAAAGWDPIAACASPELCQFSKALGEATCRAPACSAGSVSCHKGKLLRCSQGLDKWEPSATCETPALCAQTVGNNPQAERCDPAVCQPDEYSCDGSVLRHCNAGRTGWDTVIDCVSTWSCSASAKACRPCTPGDTECNHGELRTCGPGGVWEVTQTCATPAHCDPGTLSCRTPECATVGERRCVDAAGVTELQECGSSMAWVVLETCTAALCNAENRKCEAKGCRVGEARCSGDALQTCNSDQTTFVTTRVCPPGTCDPAGAGCSGAACSPGSVRCNNLHFEECLDGVWQHRERCLTPELCDAGSVNPGCREPVCGGGLGEFRCEKQLMNLEVCAPGRNDWEYVDGCRTQALCDPGPTIPNGATADAVFGFGPADCRYCEPGVTSCQGTSLYVCPGEPIPSEPIKIADCATGCMVDGAGARCNP